MHNFQIAIAPQGGSKICASHLFQLCAQGNMETLLTTKPCSSSDLPTVLHVIPSIEDNLFFHMKVYTYRAGVVSHTKFWISWDGRKQFVSKWGYNDVPQHDALPALPKAELFTET